MPIVCFCFTTRFSFIAKDYRDKAVKKPVTLDGTEFLGQRWRKAGRIHLLHASSAAEKVVLSEETLEEYLMNSKSATGIMVARPL